MDRIRYRWFKIRIVLKCILLGLFGRIALTKKGFIIGAGFHREHYLSTYLV